MNHRTYLKIDLNKLEHNFNCVRNKLPNNIKILGVIKANAYGHGAVEIGKFLDGKCDFFGVACIEEAVELKKLKRRYLFWAEYFRLILKLLLNMM